jgi:hypothetical protein
MCQKVTGIWRLRFSDIWRRVVWYAYVSDESSASSWKKQVPLKRRHVSTKLCCITSLERTTLKYTTTRTLNLTTCRIVLIFWSSGVILARIWQETSLQYLNQMVCLLLQDCFCTRVNRRMGCLTLRVKFVQGIHVTCNCFIPTVQWNINILVGLFPKGFNDCKFTALEISFLWSREGNHVLKLRHSNIPFQHRNEKQNFLNCLEYVLLVRTSYLWPLLSHVFQQ